MSSPDAMVKKNAVDMALDLISEVPVGSPIESTTDPSPTLTETISQFFNVLRCRIQDSNEEVSNHYLKIITEMLSKGFLTKYRTPGRQVISLCLQKMANPGLTNMPAFISEMIASQPALLWQLLAV